MSTPTNYEVAPAVTALMTAQGIPAAELQHMVRHSTMHRHHAGFNRRFHDWLFCVEDGTVFDMRRA